MDWLDWKLHQNQIICGFLKIFSLTIAQCEFPIRIERKVPMPHSVSFSDAISDTHVCGIILIGTIWFVPAATAAAVTTIDCFVFFSIPAPISYRINEELLPIVYVLPCEQQKNRLCFQSALAYSMHIHGICLLGKNDFFFALLCFKFSIQFHANASTIHCRMDSRNIRTRTHSGMSGARVTCIEWREDMTNLFFSPSSLAQLTRDQEKQREIDREKKKNT